MKKIIISILVILAFFECVFSDQINQSNSNLDPIELESVQNSKNQVFFDKAESKVLLTDKNVSELDKETEADLKIHNRNEESISKSENSKIDNDQLNSTILDTESSQSKKTDSSEKKDNKTESTSDSSSSTENGKEKQISLPQDNKLPKSNNEEQENGLKNGIDVGSLDTNKKLSSINSDIELREIVAENLASEKEKFDAKSDALVDNTLSSIDAIETAAKKIESEIFEKDSESLDKKILEEKVESGNSDKNNPNEEKKDQNILQDAVQFEKVDLESKDDKNEDPLDSKIEHKVDNNDEINKDSEDVKIEKDINLDFSSVDLNIELVSQVLPISEEKTENSEQLIQISEKINENKENSDIQSQDENESNDASSEEPLIQKDLEEDSFSENLEITTKDDEEKLDTLVQNEDSDYTIQSSSTEAVLSESESESPVDFGSTTVLAQYFDHENNIEETRPGLDSFSKKFGHKIKKLKQQNINNMPEEIDSSSNDSQLENTNSTNDRVCANLHNFKQILSENFEPLYLPIVSLLPEDIQLILLNESFAGIPNASLIFVALSLLTLSSFLFLAIKIIEGKKLNLNATLNNQLILQTNRIKQLEFDLKTYASLIEESEQKRNANEALMNEKESKIKELSEKLTKSIREQDLTEKESSKLKSNETKLLKETNQLRTELNSLNDVFTQQKGVFSEQIAEKDTKILELSQLIESKEKEIACFQEQLVDYGSIKEQNVKLSTELAESLNTVEILKNSLSIKNSSKGSDIEDYVQVETQEEQNVDSLMNLAQLQMEYKLLESKYDALVAENGEKNAQLEALKNDIELREKESAEWEGKLKKLEKQIKENEMQIKILNELREKDTKQHVKAITELDLQLKKKTTDADKVGHYMEQLRVKQERIQELENNLARVEKQSNMERQTFEKQAHENWLNAKKLDKELRETKVELENLKERLRDIESGVSQENLAEEPPRPPSTSSNPGGIMPPNGTNFMPFMRQQPFRYPFPPINPAQAAAFMQHLEQQRHGSTSPNQEFNRIPNMVPPHVLQRFLQSQQFMQQQMANSANSSQQISPSDLNNSNILASTALNDFSMNNMDNAPDSTQNMINDFDFSSNSGFFNQNGTETCNGYHQDSCTNENVNSNFNV